MNTLGEDIAQDTEEADPFIISGSTVLEGIGTSYQIGWIWESIVPNVSSASIMEFTNG